MPPHRLNQLAIGLFTLILAAGLVWWFLANFEQVTEEVRSEMSPEARRNPLLAAERLLDRLGLQVESRSGRQYLIHPPAQGGVLLVRDLGAPLPRQRVDELLAWVEAGGRLIAAPGRLQDDELSRPLLETFGVTYVRHQQLDELTQLLLNNTQTDEEAAQEETLSILLPGDDEPLEIEFDQNGGFEVDYPYEYWQSPDDDKPHLLIFPHGKGSVTLLSDSGFFDNDRIGDYDHAPLLAELTAGDQRCWLLYSSQMPGLVQLLWRRAPYLVTSLLLLAALLIWRMGRRSGPLILTGRRISP